MFLDLLRCPVCQTRGLCTEEGALRCSAGHTFDIARHGYASLLTGARATSGDDPAMVRARNRFLSSGAYAPLRDTVARLAVPRRSEQTRIVDVGCGTGYYLAGVLDQLPGARGLGLDTSAHALRTAARVHDRAAAVAWDVFRPFPLADRVADVVLNVFAPRNPEEFHRVLRPSARLIVVRPPAAIWRRCVVGCPQCCRSIRPRSNACSERWTRGSPASSRGGRVLGDPDRR